jgi:hypothetical protein
MTRSILVYDAGAAPFRAVADRLASRSEGLVPVAWGSEPVQAFLEAQFGERPFSLVLVEGSSVHVGETAVDRLLDGWGVDPTVATLLTRLYPPVAGPFGRVFHGREPADLHGTFPLSDAARSHADRLRRSHQIPVEPP